MRDELRSLADQALSGEDWPGRVARARTRRRQRRAAVALTVAAVVAVPVVLLAGSGQGAPRTALPAVTPNGVTTSPSPLPSSVPLSEACPSSAEAEHLRADQPPVTDAFLCGEEEVNVPGDGVWLQFTVRRITGGLDPLLQVYSTPDETRPPRNVSCTLDLPSPLLVYLHSAGPVANVRAPVTYCHKPVSAARDAYTALQTRVIWTRKDRRIQSQASIESGCVDRYKDIIEMYAETGVTHHADTPTPMPGGPLKVCRYTVTKDKEGDRIGGLTSSGTVDAAALNAELAKATVNDTCSTTEHTTFALVTGSGPPSLVVALDGCAVYQDDVGFFKGTDALRALLRG